MRRQASASSDVAVIGWIRPEFKFDTIDDLGKAARDGAGWHVCLEALEHALAVAPQRDGGRAEPRGDHERDDRHVRHHAQAEEA